MLNGRWLLNIMCQRVLTWAERVIDLALHNPRYINHYNVWWTISFVYDVIASHRYRYNKGILHRGAFCPPYMCVLIECYMLSVKAYAVDLVISILTHAIHEVVWLYQHVVCQNFWKLNFELKSTMWIRW